MAFTKVFSSMRRFIQERATPARLSSYARRIFDQGLGRAIWFSSGAVVERVATTIAPFQPERHADLWSGVGLARAYAGGADREALETIVTLATPYRSQLARGAATAARGRRLAGNQAPYTELACEVFCSLSSHEAARVTDITSENLPANDKVPAYEIWRQRLAAQFSPQQEGGKVRSSSSS